MEYSTQGQVTSRLFGYTNTYCVGSIDDMKRTFDYVFHFGSSAVYGIQRNNRLSLFDLLKKNM